MNTTIDDEVDLTLMLDKLKKKKKKIQSDENEHGAEKTDGGKTVENIDNEDGCNQGQPTMVIPVEEILSIKNANINYWPEIARLSQRLQKTIDFITSSGEEAVKCETALKRCSEMMDCLDEVYRKALTAYLQLLRFHNAIPAMRETGNELRKEAWTEEDCVGFDYTQADRPEIDEFDIERNPIAKRSGPYSVILGRTTDGVYQFSELSYIQATASIQLELNDILKMFSDNNPGSLDELITEKQRREDFEVSFL